MIQKVHFDVLKSFQMTEYYNLTKIQKSVCKIFKITPEKLYFGQALVIPVGYDILRIKLYDMLLAPGDIGWIVTDINEGIIEIKTIQAEKYIPEPLGDMVMMGYCFASGTAGPR